MKKSILSFNLFTSLILFSPLSFAHNTTSFESKYTSLTQCKTVATKSSPTESPGEGGSTKQLCPGLEGYQVYNIAEHIHSRLLLIKGKNEINILTQSDKVSAPIISGDKLEWRFKNENGKSQLVAWIYRIAGDDNDKIGAMKKLLQVVRINPESGKWCVLADVSSNEEAQKMADSGKTCSALGFQKN